MDQNQKLKELENLLKAQGVKDIKLFFDPSAVSALPSEVKAEVIEFLEAYIKGNHTPVVSNVKPL